MLVAGCNVVGGGVARECRGLNVVGSGGSLGDPRSEFRSRFMRPHPSGIVARLIETYVTAMPISAKRMTKLLRRRDVEADALLFGGIYCLRRNKTRTAISVAERYEKPGNIECELTK